MKNVIYKLVFINTSKVYIGQSIDINRRFNAHKLNLTKGSSPAKLQEAYNSFGMPSLEILEECAREDLPVREQFYIDKYNTIKCGFNSCNSSGHYPSDEVTEVAPNSNYTKDTYILVFKDLVHTNDYIKDIAERHSVSYHVVQHMSVCKNHKWLENDYPEEYKILLSKKGIRQRQSRNPRLVLSPEGEVFDIDVPLREFVRVHNILGNGAHFSSILNGKRKSCYGGWTKFIEVD